jgi:hypothetical protein
MAWPVGSGPSGAVCPAAGVVYSLWRGRAVRFAGLGAANLLAIWARMNET